MADVSRAIRERARIRGTPSLADAVAATGAVAVAIGVLLIAIDVRADHSGGEAGEPIERFFSWGVEQASVTYSRESFRLG